MEQIKHSQAQVRGLNLHVAEIGNGPKVVLFLHGFPEIWYTWRYQMIAAADAGYRAIAIDFRGYGESEQPPNPEIATFIDLVDDIVSLLDCLGISKVFLVGKDFGALPTYLVALFHPERVSGVVTLGVPFRPNSGRSYPLLEGSYTSRWQVPGRAEADFNRFDVKTVIRNVYILFARSEIPTVAPDQEVMDLVAASTPLPPWFSEEDLAVYASLYENSGFNFPLQLPYRCMAKDCGVSTDPKIAAPTLLIMGEKDYILKFPGLEDYIRSGQVRHFVPDLDITFLEEGCHFVHEQFPDKVNDLLISFLNKHSA